MLGVMQSLTGSRAYDLACNDPGCYAAMVGRGIFSNADFVIVFSSLMGLVPDMYAGARFIFCLQF